MKFILFDINESLKNSRIGSASISSNPLQFFRNNTHTNYVLLTSEAFSDGERFAARLVGEDLILSTGKTGKVTVLNGNVLVFDPDSYFRTLRTGWVRQMDVNKIKEESLRNNAFFILSEKPGPKDWEKASFDVDGTLDFGKEPIKGIALVESFDKLV